MEEGAASAKQGEEIKVDGAMAVVVTVSPPRTKAGLTSGGAPTATVDTELAAAAAAPQTVTPAASPAVSTTDAGVKSPLGRTTVGGSDACVFKVFLTERLGGEEAACPPFCLLLLTMI